MTSLKHSLCGSIEYLYEIGHPQPFLLHPTADLASGLLGTLQLVQCWLQQIWSKGDLKKSKLRNSETFDISPIIKPLRLSSLNAIVFDLQMETWIDHSIILNTITEPRRIITQGEELLRKNDPYTAAVREIFIHSIKSGITAFEKGLVKHLDLEGESVSADLDAALLTIRRFKYDLLAVPGMKLHISTWDEQEKLYTITFERGDLS